jgi:hypothetical protein
LAARGVDLDGAQSLDELFRDHDVNLDHLEDALHDFRPSLLRPPLVAQHHAVPKDVGADGFDVFGVT